MVNVTLCFSANQALLAAKAGATFVSPFVGRHDDNGFDGMALIRDIRLIYDNYPNFATEILVASVQPGGTCSRARASVRMSRPCRAAVIKALFKHVLTDQGHRRLPQGLGRQPRARGQRRRHPDRSK